MTSAALMQALPLLLTAFNGLGGKSGEHGSTYSKKARGLIDETIDAVRGMRGSQDITQQPGYQTGLGWLQDMFSDPEFFNRFEAPLQRQFQEQTVPDLANRFAAMGSGGALGSTAFRNQLGREGSNLSTNIAALRGNMQQNAIPQLLGYSQQPFSNYMSMLNSALTPTQNTYQPPSAGFLGGVAPGIISGFAQGYGNKWGEGFAGNSGSPSPDAGYGAGWDSMFRQQGAV